MKIIGTGSYTPSNKVSNDDMANIVETSDEWIRERTGIVNRRISTGENTSDMAIIASKMAIEEAGINPIDIDKIILATMSPDSNLPNTACRVQAGIGADNAHCFDINAACSGFLFALNTANAYLASGMAKIILVIGAETLSKTVDFSDRSTCVLFGDGAGAMLVSTDESKKYMAFSASDGEKGLVLTGTDYPVMNPYCKSDDEYRKYIQMDGKEVFKFAVTKVPYAIEKVLEIADKSVDDVDLFILHQANTRILSSVAKRLKVSDDKIPSNISEYGNTSAASIPLLFDELRKNKTIKDNMKLVLSGFGGGLTYGAAYLET